MKNLDPILAIAQQSSSHIVPSKQTATKPRRIIQQSRTMSSWSIRIIRWVIWPYPTNLYPLTTIPHKYPTYRKHHPASSNQLEHSHGLSHQSERAPDVIQPIRTQSLRPYIYPIRTSKRKTVGTNCARKRRCEREGRRAQLRLRQMIGTSPGSPPAAYSPLTCLVFNIQLGNEACRPVRCRDRDYPVVRRRDVQTARCWDYGGIL